MWPTALPSHPETALSVEQARRCRGGSRASRLSYRTGGERARARGKKITSWPEDWAGKSLQAATVFAGTYPNVSCSRYLPVTGVSETLAWTLPRATDPVCGLRAIWSGRGSGRGRKWRQKRARESVCSHLPDLLRLRPDLHRHETDQDRSTPQPLTLTPSRTPAAPSSPAPLPTPTLTRPPPFANPRFRRRRAGRASPPAMGTATATGGGAR